VNAVAEIHHTTLAPSKLELLTGWLPGQRWYAAKGSTPVLRKVGGYRLDDPAGRVGIEVLIVADESGRQPVVYQVPLTYRGAPLPGAEHALVGTAEHGVLRTRWVYDAPHDEVFAAQLLALIQGQAEPQAQSTSNTPDPTVERHSVDRQTVTLASASVLRGEQSNTSIICEVVDRSGSAAPPVMVKVFRSLHPGENPGPPHRGVRLGPVGRSGLRGSGTRSPRLRPALPAGGGGRLAGRPSGGHRRRGLLRVGP
jgi:1,4-alpha-glucan branching enzyme